MKSVLDQYVGCIDCMASITVQQAFDEATEAWPQQSRIAFQCRNCGVVNHLLLEKNVVIEGYLDGVIDPDFVETRVVHFTDLRVKPHRSGIRIKNLNLSWDVPSKSSQN